jgi:aminoglycoside 6'-N-acetyltransferase I
MRIRTLRAEDRKAVEQVASLLLEGFKEHHPTAWPDIEAALEEVEESFAQDRLSRIAVDDSGAVLGWIGGIRQYDGNVWELHPLVVRASHQRTGIGRALVADLEERVRERNGLTLWLGSDDENSQTTLSATDLYPAPLSHIARIKNLRDHPYEFYQKVGFVIVGVMPDANGWGKPDIFMAKRLKSDQA